MADAARPARLDEVVIADRRRKVAALYLRHQTMQTIADQLKVHVSTISDDVAALKEEWRKESLNDIGELILREASELDEMEAYAAVECAKGKPLEWFDRRLKVKERRAKLLGLDQPTRVDATSGGQSLAGEWPLIRARILQVVTEFPEDVQLRLAEALADGS